MTAEDASTADEQDTATQDDDRPKPYPHDGEGSAAGDASGDAGGSDDGGEAKADDAKADDGAESKAGDGEKAEGDGDFTYGEDETQDFVDRDKIDFDPADGLYTGSAVDGDSDIPGPSEGEIREAQEELGDDEDGDAGAKKAAEKFIEDNDVDLEEAKKGEAIAGSAQSSGDKGDDS